jgi:hypothetical protein
MFITTNSIPFHILANLLKLVQLSAAFDLRIKVDLHFPKKTKKSLSVSINLMYYGNSLLHLIIHIVMCEIEGEFISLGSQSVVKG